MKIKCRRHTSALGGLMLLIFGVLVSSFAGAAGWSGPGGAKWGAKVLALTSVAATGSSVAISYVFLEPTGAINVNTCPSYYADTTSLGTGISSVVFLMVHSSLTAMSDVQKAQISELQVAASAGKEVLIYSNGCTSATAPGYNTVDGVWVKY